MEGGRNDLSLQAITIELLARVVNASGQENTRDHEYPIGITL